MSSTTIDVWPQLGTTVTLASGYVITAAGAESLPTDEILGLIRSQRLLTSDPTALYPNPSPIPPITTGGGLTVPSMALLALTPAIIPGATCEVLGFYTINDGGGGLFFADVGSSTTVVPGMVVAALGGRWKRVYDPAYVHLKWFGAYGDASHDDTAAVQLAFDNARDGGTVYVDSTTQGYRITSCIKVGLGSPGNAKNALSVVGGGPTAAETTTPTFFWDGASATDPMFWCCGYDFSFWNFGIQLVNGRTLYSGIEIGNFAASPVYFTSAARFQGITIYSDSMTKALLNGITIGSKFPQGGNLERMFFESVSFQGVQQCCVRLTSGQPFNTSFIRCLFYGLHDMPLGQGIYINVPSCTVQFTDCDFEGLELGIICTQNCQVSIQGGQAELCKKLYQCYLPGGVLPGAFTCRNLRMSNTYIGVAGNGPNFFAAGDHRWIRSAGNQTLILEGNSMCDNGVGYMEVAAETPVISRGNIWPNTAFFQVTAPTTAGPAAGIRSEGDSVYSTPTFFLPLPRMTGGYNASSTATVSAAATSVAVLLPNTEVDTTYGVTLAVESVTGAPASGAFNGYVTSKTTTGFTINVPTAPAGTTAVTYRYTITR